MGYTDPILELHNRGYGNIFELTSDGVTNEDAEVMLEVMNEVEAEERAASLSGTLRAAGLLW